MTEFRLDTPALESIGMRIAVWSPGASARAKLRALLSEAFASAGD